MVSGGNTFSGKYFKVVNDIEMTTAVFSPIGVTTYHGNQFRGIFDGGGHTINNLKVSGFNYCGLFAYVGSGGKVQNLMLTNVDIASVAYMGGVAAQNYGTIENCFVSGEVGYPSSNNCVGGITGVNAGKIINCVSTCNLNGSHVGGIADRAGTDAEFANCVVYSGALNGSSRKGKLMSYNAGTITNCYSTEKATLTGAGTEDDGSAGTHVSSSAMTAAWWRDTAKFNMDTVWQWVDVNSPPKLRVQ